MATDGMKRLARGEFYWAGMSREIENLYMSCEGCKENSRSKPNVNGKRNEVTPSTLETGAPGELLCSDFGQYGRSNLLIIKDRYSGLLRVYLTPDKSTEAATAGLERWAHSYRVPREICSDQGPCYGEMYSQWCSSMGIRHCVSSAYNSQSNGAAEKGVGQIKTLLEKMGRKGVMNQRELNQLCFKINSHQSSREGSPLECFYGRYVWTYQPELVRKKIQHQQIIAARGESRKRYQRSWGEGAKTTSNLEKTFSVKS